MMTDRLPDIQTVAYAECAGPRRRQDHRLPSDGQGDVLPHGPRLQPHHRPRHGLHKMIRLMTISTGGGLPNFMGNGSRHPVDDFPPGRWAATPQWSLARNGFLVRLARDFDRAMIRLIKKYKVLPTARLEPADGRAEQDDGLLARAAARLQLAPHGLDSRLRLPVQGPGKYVPILSTDEKRFGGQERQAMDSGTFVQCRGRGREQASADPYLQHLAHRNGSPPQR